MSTLVTKEGLKSLAPELSERHVLAEIVERLIKGDNDPVRLTELASTIGIGTPAVAKALESLTDQGLISITCEDWNSVGSFVVDGVTVALSPSQAAMDIRQRNPESSRKDDLEEDFEVDGVQYTAWVVDAHHEEDSDEVLLSIERVDDPDGTQPTRSIVVEGKHFDDEDEAWEWLEEWKAATGTKEVAPAPTGGRIRVIEIDGYKVRIQHEPRFLEEDTPMDRFSFALLDPKFEGEDTEEADWLVDWVRSVAPINVPGTEEEFLTYVTGLATKRAQSEIAAHEAAQKYGPEGDDPTEPEGSEPELATA